MAQTSTKSKNTLIITVIIVPVVSSIGATIVINFSLSMNQKDNVTVSGRVVSTGVLTLFEASLQTIEFVDVQTGTKTSYVFPFPQQSYNPIGNYSVVLVNGHVYDVIVSYYTGPTGGMQSASDNIGTFTVHASEGQTSIHKDFP